MTQGGPGHETATTTVFMYQLKQAYIGESAALSVINFGLVIVVVLVFLKVRRWPGQGAAFLTGAPPPRRRPPSPARRPPPRRPPRAPPAPPSATQTPAPSS